MGLIWGPRGLGNLSLLTKSTQPTDSYTGASLILLTRLIAQCAIDHTIVPCTRTNNYTSFAQASYITEILQS